MKQKIQKHALSLKKQPLGGVSKTIDKVKSEFKVSNMKSNQSALKISQQNSVAEQEGERTGKGKGQNESRVSDFGLELSAQTQKGHNQKRRNTSLIEIQQLSKHFEKDEAQERSVQGIQAFTKSKTSQKFEIQIDGQKQVDAGSNLKSKVLIRSPESVRKKIETPSFCQTNDPNDKANIHSVLEAERNMPSPSKPKPSGFQSIQTSPQKLNKQGSASKPNVFSAPSVSSPMNKYSDAEDMKLLESTDYKKASILNPLPSLKSKNLRDQSPFRTQMNSAADESQINLTNQAKSLRKEGATKGVSLAGGFDRSKTPFLQIQKFGQLNKLESKTI